MATSDTVETPEKKPEPKPQPAPQPQPRAEKRPSTAWKIVRRVIVLGLLFGVPLLLMIGLFGFIGSMMTPAKGITEKAFSSRLWKEGEHKIAVIHLSGTIMSGEGYIKDQIEQVIKDKSVKGVVLRVNSPGGLVSGSNNIYRRLVEMREIRGAKGNKLPMVVSMGALCASGGYYAAMAVEDTPESIYAEPITWTGSIGVIIPHYNFEKFCEKHGIEEDSIKSHDLKGMGGIAKKLKPEEEAIFKELVNDSFARFKKLVAGGRPKMTTAEIDKVATGQVFTTKQALENGLVDHEGYVEDAIAACIKMAKLKESNVRVVEYEKPQTLTDLFLAKAEQPELDMKAVLRMATPKRYYIAPQWLPGIVTDPEK